MYITFFLYMYITFHSTCCTLVKLSVIINQSTRTIATLIIFHISTLIKLNIIFRSQHFWREPFFLGSRTATSSLIPLKFVPDSWTINWTIVPRGIGVRTRYFFLPHNSCLFRNMEMITNCRPIFIWNYVRYQLKMKL